MHVLITGMTNQHCNRGTRLKYSSVTLALKEILLQNHEVDHSAISLTEDCMPYDFVFFGLFNPSAIGSGFLYGMLHGMALCREWGVPYVLYVDDWQLNTIAKTWRGMRTKGPDSFIRENLEGMRQELDLALTMKERLFESVESFDQILIPKYTWGDGGILQDALDCKRPIFFDPSNFAIKYDIKPRAPRERSWVCGSLSDCNKWLAGLDIGWPIHYFGGKKSKAETMLQESDLVGLYANSWGVLSPPYDIDGSGWWRNRFLFAAQTGSIILPSTLDCDALDWQLSGREIEAMSSSELAHYAMYQRDVILGALESREDVIDKVEELLVDC